jgi:hypothetical protein
VQLASDSSALPMDLSASARHVASVMAAPR